MTFVEDLAEHCSATGARLRDIQAFQASGDWHVLAEMTDHSLHQVNAGPDGDRATLEAGCAVAIELRCVMRDVSI